MIGGPSGPAVVQQPWEPFWEQARSISDHGAEMVAWLRGERTGHPGYLGPPALETARLTPYLVQLNAAGLVTIGSQPSLAEKDWEQRAFLEAYGPPMLVERVATRLRDDGLEVDAWPTSRVVARQRAGRRVVTRTPSDDVTVVGRWAIDEVMADIARLAAAPLLRTQLSATWSMTAYDPRWPGVGTDYCPDRLFRAACVALEGSSSGSG